MNLFIDLLRRWWYLRLLLVRPRSDDDAGQMITITCTLLLFFFRIRRLFLQQQWKTDMPTAFRWWRPIRSWCGGLSGRGLFTCWPSDLTRNLNSSRDYTEVGLGRLLLVVTTAHEQYRLCALCRGSQGEGQEADHARLVCHRPHEGSSLSPSQACLERRSRRLAILQRRGEEVTQKVCVRFYTELSKWKCVVTTTALSVRSSPCLPAYSQLAAL